MEMIAEYSPEDDSFLLTDQKDVRIRMSLTEMDTLRETVGIALSDRFLVKGAIQ